VGKVGGKQVINLQSGGCTTKIGTIIHELMHSVGFYHEQNREERDSHVEIRMQNVKPGMEVNFRKLEAGRASGFGVGYDYGSVMHYSKTAFSRNGQPTIYPKVRNSKENLEELVKFLHFFSHQQRQTLAKGKAFLAWTLTKSIGCTSARPRPHQPDTNRQELVSLAF
jgi:Astacin (Peptidase family M12A)